MINTYLKFEARIPNGSKFVALTRNCTKFLSLKANLTLKVKVKVTRFRTPQKLLCSQGITQTTTQTTTEPKTMSPPHNILVKRPFFRSVTLPSNYLLTYLG